MKAWCAVKFDVPNGALHILRGLNLAGYEAYLVGGCVRDLLRGVPPHDWDICTSARPDQVEACFDGLRAIETGLRHGTVTLLADGEAFEVTTYRTDGQYSDGRRPDSVRFVSDLTEDLARRDFTMNAIAADAKGNLRDPFHGAEDIRAGIIRCVGAPESRFREDGLRVMRAIRFAAVLGYALESATAAAVHDCRGMLERVAAERVQSELRQLLAGESAGAVLRAYADVLCVFWPELGKMAGFPQRNPWHSWDVWEHTLRTVEAAPADPALRLTMLLHDIGKPDCHSRDDQGVDHFYGHPAVSARMADDMLRRLKFDSLTRTQVVTLVANHDVELPPRERLIRRMLNKLGEERFFQLLEVKCADCMGQRPERVQARLAQLDAVRTAARELIDARGCFALRDLAIGGRDLIDAGFAPGPQLGRTLERLLDKVLDGELPNERQALLAEAAKLRELTP